MLNLIPQEVFQDIICLLQPQDLKALRLVSRSFCRDASQGLFRRLDISCLTFDRLANIGHHPILAPMVEELYYHEMQFHNIGSGGADRHNGDIDTHWRTVSQFQRQCSHDWAQWTDQIWTDQEDTMQFLARDFDMAISPPPTSSSVEFDSQPTTEADFKSMMTSIHELYAQYTQLQQLRSLSQYFCQYLPLFPKLNRLVSIDANAGGIALSYPSMERHCELRRLQEYFPLSDATIRTWFRNENHDWAGHGFIALLDALNLNRSLKISHLEIRRDDDLFMRRGIAVRNFEDLRQNIKLGEPPRWFENLETLKLCLDVPPREALSDVMVGLEYMSQALALAQNLRCLEICSTSLGRTAIPITLILPIVTLVNLHIAMLESFEFSTKDMCRWLFLQPNLEHLTLRSPQLQGKWRHLADRLYERADFSLKTLNLTDLWDDDSESIQEGEMEDIMVPSRVSSEDLVHYINHGGQNPFEKRRWRFFTPRPGIELTEDDRISNYSDMSEWLPEHNPNPEDEFVGLEYDENYDSDRKSDSDIRMEDVRY